MATGNFDSTGLSNGNDMFELMQNAETQLIENRTKFLKGLKNVKIADIENLNDYLLELMNKFTTYQNTLLKKNTDIIKKTNEQASILIENELENAYKVGVNTAEREVDEKIRETPETTPEKKALIENTKRATTESQLQAVNSSQQDFNRLAGLIVGAVFTASQIRQDKSLFDIVDEQQRRFNEKGVSGKRTTRGNIQLSSYNTSVIRENSQKTMLAGSGAVDSADDVVYISQHASASDACRPHQGKKYIDDVWGQGRNPRGLKLPLLSSVIDKPGEPGLFHYNCRHKKTYAPKGFEKPEPPKNVKVNKGGRVDSTKAKQTYQIEQSQRRYQDNIRKYKQIEKNALTEQEQLRAKTLVRNNQAKLRGLQKVAEKNNIPFYRQPHKENIEFKFKTFKPEF